MTKKQNKAETAEVSDEKFVTIQTDTNPITVGTVPLAKLVRRRDNFRKMTPQQKAALQASINASGMQSFIAVVKNPDGTYGIVDGHHRMEELTSRGVQNVPVVVLPEQTSKEEADLAMLSFNVSAEIVDDKFSELLIDLMNSGVEKAQIATAAVVSQGFIDRLSEALAAPAIEAGEEELPTEGLKLPGATKAKKAPRVKVLLLSNEEGVQLIACTHAETIISSEVRDMLGSEGLKIDEVEPIWVDNDVALIEKLSEESDE